MTAFASCLRQLVLRSGRAPNFRACTPPAWHAGQQQYQSLHTALSTRGLHGHLSPTPPQRGAAASAEIETSRRIEAPDGLVVAKDGGRTSSTRLHARSSLRWALKQYSEDHPPPAALVRPARQYPSQVETRRSKSKHINSTRRQSLHDIKQLVGGRPDNQWRDTLSLLVQHTPDSRELLNFRVTIGKGAAAEARKRLLSGLDTNVWQISRRYQSVIHVEEGDGSGSLALNLSGSETAVRHSLLEVLRVVGQLTALRVHNAQLRAALAKQWETASETTSRVKLLEVGEIATEDRTLTLQDEARIADTVEQQAMPDKNLPILDDTYTTYTKYRPYALHTRADEIKPPVIWTKHLFEKYIAALVHGEVSPQEVAKLYGSGPSHQEVVTSLLVRSFTSDETRPAISLSALKMALLYLQKKGPGFRPANEQIFAQIELQDLPADAETYTILLIGASKVGDLASYTSVLKTMIRKGIRPQAKAWLAFLELIQDSGQRLKILNAMRRKGLNQTRTSYDEIARHQVLIELESQVAQSTKADNADLGSAFDIGAFVQQQDQRYGKGWFDTATLNKILVVLGRGLKFDSCKQLLALSQRERRVIPDEVTLNTLLTHIRNIPEWLSLLDSLLSTYTWMRPDRVTFQILFSIAWALNKPNMMAVIWRYSTIASIPPSKMQAKLNSLLARGNSGELTARLRGRQAWAPIIFGCDELQKSASTLGAEVKQSNFYSIAADFMETAHDKMPSVSFARKLREAYEKDLALYKLKNEKGELTIEEMRELSVDIPMERKLVFRKQG